MQKQVKTIITIAIVLASHYSFSQISKGSILVNASFGYTQSTTSASYNIVAVNSKADSVRVPNSKTNTLTAGIDVAYFIVDNLCVGISCGYSNSTSPVNAQGYNNAYYSWNNVTHNFAPGIFAIKYFMVSDKFYLSAELHCYYTTGSINDSYLYNYKPAPIIDAFPTEPTTGYNISLSPGIEYFPSLKWHIGFRLANVLGYNSTTLRNIPNDYEYAPNPNSLITSNMTTHTFDVGFGLVPTLGVSYIFAPKPIDKPSTN